MSSQSANPDRIGFGAGMALLCFATFSLHDTVIKVLGAQYATFQIIFFGTLFAFLPMTVLLLADRTEANLRPRHPWLVTGRVACNITSGICAFYAFTKLPLAEAYALIFASPLWITVLSVPLLGETVRLRRAIAVIIGLTGVIVVLRPGVTDLTLGHAAALTASLSSALQAIIVRKIGPDERTPVLMLYPMLAVILVMAAILPWVYKPMPLADLGLMASIGLLATVGQVFMIAAFKAAPAALVAPFQYSQILWAVFYGYFLFGDVPDIWVGTGAGIIIASGLFVVWRESRADVSTTRPFLRVRNLRPDTIPILRHRLRLRRGNGAAGLT